MKNTISLLILVFSISTSVAQHYQKVKIHLPNDESLRIFKNLPIAADHGSWRGTTVFETDLNQADLAMVNESGLASEVLIENVVGYYQKRLAEGPGVPKSSSACDNDEINTPAGFTLGSMSSYFTYNEFKAHLDNMVSLYPNLITTKAPIGTFETWDGNPIYWVRISDNAAVDENEPEVLYTAIHHAREAGTLSQLIFYMYYILENYYTDPSIKELVDNTEMYFIPMVNPDGYQYNQGTNPDGGGMWRKNRRPNGGSFGVDLNRNYSYQWGGAGTSSDPTSDVYKGPSSMSEPETQAMEWFAQQHDFVTALNFHSYADQLLFPWGYSDNLQCSHHDEFSAICEEMVSENGYLAQQSAVLYPAAGDSDDWGYGETGTKPRIYSMTCEIGGENDGFWPAQSRIIPIAKENVYLNLTLARSATNYASITDLEPTLQSDSGHFSYRLERLGWEPGTFTVSVEPLVGITSIGASNTHSGLGIGETVEDSIFFVLQPDLVVGDPIKYVLAIDNGLYVTRDTLTKVYGPEVQLFANGGAPTQDWEMNNAWGLTTSTFVSSPNSLTDSPNGNYPNDGNRKMETAEPIDLSGLSQAFLRFNAKWEIETGWDYAQISASTNGTNWTPLCGNYTKVGNEYQDEDEPVYDGEQDSWIQEEIDLSDFIGESVYFQFRMVSDASVREDGMYIDDVELVGLAAPDVAISTSNSQADHYLVYPNPSEGQFNLRLKSSATVSVFNTNAQLLSQQMLEKGNHILDGSEWNPGIYILRIRSQTSVFNQRISIQ